MKIILLIAFLSFSNIGFCQLRIVNVDNIDNGSNILFKDLINHVSIEGMTDFRHHIVTVKGGASTLIGGNNMLVKNLLGNTATITVSGFSKTGKKETTSTIFTIETAGEPSVELKEENDESFSNGQVLNRSRLEVTLPNSNYNGNYEVAHFEISLSDSLGNSILPLTFVSEKYLGKDINDKILSLSKGGKILFTHVILTYKDGGYKEYKDFSLLIK